MYMRRFTYSLEVVLHFSQLGYHLHGLSITRDLLDFRVLLDCQQEDGTVAVGRV
jgi:hypothetical protein